MRDGYVKKVIFVMAAIAIVGGVFLYFLSDERIEAAKRISYVFDVDISENAKREKEIYKEPSFHGDGISSVKLEAPQDELNDAIRDLDENKDLKKIEPDNEYVISVVNYVREKGIGVSELSDYEIYAKSKNDYVSEIDYFANFYLILVNPDNSEIIFIESDT